MKERGFLLFAGRKIHCVSSPQSCCCSVFLRKFWLPIGLYSSCMQYQLNAWWSM